MISEPASQRTFLGMAALLFAAGAMVTTIGCLSMSGMGEMPMPGGWTMSMVWMRMPGQTWLGAGASFLGMWIAMMVAMMLPSLLSVLIRYRVALAKQEVHLNALTTLVSLGYFSVWTVLGMVVFAGGVALAAAETTLPALARAVPIAAGVVVLTAGVLQFTRWKARQLACCRMAPNCGRQFRGHTGMAWRHGLRLGLQLGIRCCYCCAGLTTLLLVMGLMNLRAMALVTMATTWERLTPAPERAARAIGVVVVGAGLYLIARSA